MRPRTHLCTYPIQACIKRQNVRACLTGAWILPLKARETQRHLEKYAHVRRQEPSLTIANAPAYSSQDSKRAGFNASSARAGRVCAAAAASVSGRSIAPGSRLPSSCGCSCTCAFGSAYHFAAVFGFPVRTTHIASCYRD